MNVAMGKSVRQPGYISLVVLTGEMAQAVARKSFLMPMHQFASLIQHSERLLLHSNLDWQYG